MYIFQPDRYLLKQQLRSVASYVHGDVLDVGAGDYARYKSLFSYSKYITMDHVKSENTDVVGRIEDIPFPDNSFDSVICTQVLEHVPNPFMAVAELRRVLRPTGTCLITVPQMNEIHEAPRDYFRYTQYGIRSIFEGAGMECIEELQRGGYRAVRAQLFIRHLIDRYALYREGLFSKVIGKYLSVYGKYAVFRDAHDMSEASRKHAIGWCFVFKKK